MKRLFPVFFLLVVISFSNVSFAQNDAILSKLRQKYNSVSFSSSENVYYIYSNDSKYGVADINGVELIAPGKYTYISPDRLSSGKIYGFKVGNGDKRGYCDAKGVEIISPNKYTNVYANNDYKTGEILGFVLYINEYQGYGDANGNVVITPDRYTYIYVSRNYKTNDIEYFKVKINDKEGVCDINAKEIIPPHKYNEVLVEQNVMTKVIRGFKVKNNGKVGYCSSTGNEIITPQKYTNVKTRYNDRTNKVQYFEVNIGDKSGWCNSDGNEIVPPKYDWVNAGKYGFSVGNGEYVGFLDKNGTELITPDKYNTVTNTSGLCYTVKKGEYEGVLSLSGKEIISPDKYVRVDVQYADIDKDKNVDSIEGYCVALEKHGKFGYCDCKGNVVIKPKYKNTVKKITYDGIVRYSTQIDEGFCLIDEKERVLVKGFNNRTLHIEEGLLAYKKGGKWGYVSFYDGSVVIPFEYDQIQNSFNDGVATLIKDGKPVLVSNPLKTVANNANHPKTKSRAVSTYPAANSEVDKNIPNGSKADVNANTYAFIIANENYVKAKVPYALNDGWTFEQYCKKTLGIKDENVHLYEDATGGNIASCVEQMKQVAKAADGKAAIIFYYAGHAFPDEERATAYLLPVDGDSKNTSTGYSLERLYKELNSVNAKQIVCLLDACFSGTTRDDQMLLTGRGVAIKVKEEVPQGNMVVITSATGAETAHSYEDMHHGLFTYYLLEKLQQAKGDINLGDLSDYVTKMVKRQSVIINQKKQTPTVIPSPSLQASWRNIKL